MPADARPVNAQVTMPLGRAEQNTEPPNSRTKDPLSGGILETRCHSSATRPLELPIYRQCRSLSLRQPSLTPFSSTNLTLRISADTPSPPSPKPFPQIAEVFLQEHCGKLWGQHCRPVVLVRGSQVRSRIHTVKCHPHGRDHHEAHHASLRPHRPSRQPHRAVERRAQQMPRGHAPAVGNGIEKTFSPIPRRVKSHGEPERSRAPQREAEEESNRRSDQDAAPVFSAIAKVDQAKRRRERRRGPPEANPARQREQRVAAEQELFIKSHQQKRPRPERSELRQARAVEYDVAKIKNVQPMEQHEQQRNSSEAPTRPHPEQLAEGLAQRQSVSAPAAMLHPRQHQRRNRCRHEERELECRPRTQRTQIPGADQIAGNSLQQKKRERVECESPARAQAIAATVAEKEKRAGVGGLRRRNEAGRNCAVNRSTGDRYAG